MRVAFVAVLAAFVAAASAAPLTEAQYQALFERYVSQYDKQYETNEFFAKYNTFKANLDSVIAHNAKNASWSQAINEFGDLSSAEFAAKMGLRPVKAPQAKALRTKKPKSSKRNGDSFDWREEDGKVNKIKNQGQCGSCWAFSATASLETTFANAKGTLYSFAESELVDCSTSYGNEGCNGGLMTQAFEYIKDNGITTSDKYPYVAKDNTCKAKGTPRTGSLESYYDLPAGDEAALKAAIDETVVAVAVDATAMQFYSSGIIDEACSGGLNHGIAAVGYGVEGSKKFFIVRNSWGSSWGEAGYARLLQGVDPLCVTQMSTVPVVGADF